MRSFWIQAETWYPRLTSRRFKNNSWPKSYKMIPPSSLPIKILAALTAFNPLTGWGLEVNSLFSNHAVLQQDKPVPVWGTAEAGQTVEVVFGERSAEGVADESGKWLVVLDSLSGSLEPATMSIRSG